MSALPKTAMVLAAGLGMRMRPLTATTPKPLIRIEGKTLLDYGLDSLQAAGVDRVVINIHHLGEQIIQYVAARFAGPATSISDESTGLLDSAGGIVKALPLLGNGPFVVLNADTFWIDTGEPDLVRLGHVWDDERMDILLMLADPYRATGHVGSIDFRIDAAGRLARAHGSSDGFIYAGAAILHPRIFAGAKPQPHSLNLYFDKAIEKGRLFGLPMRGHWITVGTPDAIVTAEEAVKRLIQT